MSHFPPILSRTGALLRGRAARRVALTLVLGCGMSTAAALGAARARTDAATAQINLASERLDALTDASVGGDQERAAIAWGYLERQRLGLESPFRLVEAASRDPRLTAEEQGTLSLALLARLTRGQAHVVDPAAFDRVGPSIQGEPVPGESHIALIERAISHADDPRAAELAVRFAYTLAAAEGIVDPAAPLLAAEAAALIGDREIARREANALLRTARQGPIEEIAERRERRAFYVERPVLLVPGEDLERTAVEMTDELLLALRGLTLSQDSAAATPSDTADRTLASFLYDAAGKAPPAAALAVTVQRYLPLLRAQAPAVPARRVARARNAEMLAAAVAAVEATRAQRQAISRMLLAAGVAMRSAAQEPVWFPGDPAPTIAEAAVAVGVARIEFDRDVPAAWRPYFLKTLVSSVADARRVIPGLTLDALTLRFRMTSPADSALAMHDPRTRTLHLPVFTAAGAFTHELAHDLDRESAVRQGHAGYRSDFVTRPAFSPSAANRLGASLRALTEEITGLPRAARAKAERPAEIFATRVDWFVANALAREGYSSGFLSAVQDELLTGHVIHPERLQGAGRSRSLLTALEEMTTLSPLALRDQPPSVHTLLRWSLNGPVDREVAASIVRGNPPAWAPGRLIGERVCEDDERGRVQLMRMAAESRARGWLRQRATWIRPSERPAWARAALGEEPWSPALVAERVAGLRDYMLVELASTEELPAGISAYAAPLAVRARCT